MENDQKIFTEEQAKNMVEAAVAEERKRIVAALDSMRAGIQIAEAAYRLQMSSQPRQMPYRPKERDFMDKCISALTFRVF
mgnify:CR=1 FL=1